MSPDKSLLTKILTILLALVVVLAGCMLMSSFNASKTPAVHTNRIGIDVSKHQKRIDWPKVAKQSEYKIEFVYIKATEGASYVDPMFQTNLKGAKQAGFKVGVYHFFRLSSSVESQFENFKKNVPRNAIDLVPMIDVELEGDWKKYPNLTIKEIQSRLEAFISLVKKHYGCAPMIYGTQRSYNTFCAPTFNNYHLYIGRYGPKSPVIKGRGTYTIWQYSETGRIQGITKPVDLCEFNKKYSLRDITIK